MSTDRLVIGLVKALRIITFNETRLAPKSLPLLNKWNRSQSTIAQKLLEGKENSILHDVKLDIDVKGLQYNLVLFNSESAWYYFEKIKQNNKLHLVTEENLSELLKSIKFPDFGRADGVKVQQRIGILLETIYSLNFKLNESDYRHLIAIYGFLKLEKEVASLWQQLNDSVVIPSIYSYTSLSYAYLELNKPDKVFEIYGQLQASDIWPNGQFYLLLMKAYSQLKNGEKVIETFNTYLALYESEDIQKGDKVSSQAYRKFFSCIEKCNAGYSEEMQRYFNLMVQSGITPLEIHFKIIMGYHLDQGNLLEGINWFDKMTEFEIEPRMGNYIRHLIAHRRTPFIELFCKNLSQAQLSSILNHLNDRLGFAQEVREQKKIEKVIKRVIKFLE
ncbi:hypothetical protein K502DRAFT_362817 [Neoconidiobolus thromboides FSU 785]|nr:hypothetical protein K502DRAFT_362817 [Neoconidiobolus thromboides FSU 785]